MGLNINDWQAAYEHVKNVSPAPVEETPATPQWPTADAAMFHGLAGEFVRIVGPHSEADPVALLLQFLIAFGSIVGGAAHRIADGAEHRMNLFLVLIGDTAKGRKGTAWSWVRRVFDSVDPSWTRDRIQSGLSSGEGLLWAVRDRIEKREPVREKGRPTGEYQEIEVDAGVGDKRLCALEQEFASVLRTMNREGNILSAMVRQAWDSGDLRVLTKNSPAKATGAHISIVAHITVDELQRSFTDTEAGNGFGNRFLWALVRRSKLLPFGGQLPDGALSQLGDRVRLTAETIRRGGRFVFSKPAEDAWVKVYEALSAGRPGLLGALLARSEAQALRLACCYAALDGSLEIAVEHLRAALAVMEYVERSVEFVFGRSLGDPDADKILEALRVHPAGMTRTQIRDLFHRNRSEEQIDRALNSLRRLNLAACRFESGGNGRPAERWTATKGTNG